jgi:uncharacterized protein (TIGR02996 family)
MSDAVDVLLQALHADPADATAWLALADGLEESDQLDRATLTRLTQQLRTLPQGKERSRTESTVQGMLRNEVLPCVPVRRNALGMTFVLIPPGVFRMGSVTREKGRDADEGPVHEVEITRPFYLSAYQVTQEQYDTVMGENPSVFASTGESASRVANLDTRTFPVDSVSWEEAVAFCQKLDDAPYRLPTEAEWEYACRAGTSTPFHYGLGASALESNFDGNFPTGKAKKGPYLARTCPVGSYAPNGFGLFDMHGNVWEWCSDWFDESWYSHSPRQDPTGPETGHYRVLRGGSWDSYGKRSRSACRRGDDPGLLVVGFRIVLPYDRIPF